tara:strand:- start:1497 stop:2726 length:1230 start_codon:yes stop_codon:yes gene_type:complete
MNTPQFEHKNLRKTILFVESGTYGGGSAESLYQFLKYIDRDVFEPIVFFLNYNHYCEKISNLGISYVVFSHWLYNKEFNQNHGILIKWFWRFYSRLLRIFPQISIFCESGINYKVIKKIQRLVQKENVQLIHTNNQVDRDIYAIEAARKEQVKCVAHLRSFNSHLFNSKKAEYINKHVNQIIAFTRNASCHWASAGVAEQKIQVINNAIENIEVKPLNLCEEFNLPLQSFTIGIVGRIISERGHIFLINAFSKVEKIIPNSYLIIIGEGDDQDVEPLKQRVQELKLSSKVIFSGYYPNAQDIIAALNVLVLPYKIEPFGRVVLEAWQLKTPVILTRIGFIEEFVKHKETGLLVDYADMNQLTRAIVQIYSDNYLRESIVEKAYKNCQEKYSIQNYTNIIQKIYLKLLNI